MIKEKIKVKFQIFPKKSDKLNDTNYRIFKCSSMNIDSKLKTDKNFMFSIKGDISYLNENDEIDCALELIETNQYGSTYKILEIFNFGDFSKMTYSEKKCILTTIASERNATTLLSQYPNFLEEMLTFGKEHFDLSKLHGIKKAKISSYERQLFSKYKYYSIMQANKLYDITIEDCKALIQEFKTNEGISIALEENPYRVLIDVLGRSFVYKSNNGSYNGVDKLLCDIRPDLKESKIRCEYLMLAILDKNETETGSTKLFGNILAKSVNDYAPELLGLVKEVATNCDGIYYDYESKCLGKMSSYIREVKIFEFLKDLVENNNKLDWDFTKFKKFNDGTGEATEEQLKLLKTFCENRLTILNAGAGCGKTYGTKALIAMLKYYGLTYTNLTFTGKASKRFKEATNEVCSTIHKQLLKDGGTNADVIIVDEVSMINPILFEMIIDCVQNENVRLVLIGDLLQAPPIQSPSVIKELVNCKMIDIVEYTKCFRFAQSGIAEVSTNCRNGNFYIHSKDFDKNTFIYGNDKDYKFIKFNDTMEQILNCYNTALKKYKPNEITVLSCWNVKEYGTININNHIQALVNPPKPNEKTMKIKRNDNTILFRENDLVMNCKNKYDCMTEDIYNELIEDKNLTKEDFKCTTSVMNGSVGRILFIDDDIMKIEFDETIVIFTKKDIGNLLLAYSVTTLKMQGSSTPCVITLTIPQHKKSLNRQILYTSLTRCSKMLYEIGDLDVIEYACSNMADDDRETWLKQLLLERDLLKINP